MMRKYLDERKDQSDDDDDDNRKRRIRASLPIGCKYIAKMFDYIDVSCQTKA